jgi:Septum formation
MPRALALTLVLVALVSACSDDDPPSWLVERANPSTTTSVPAPVEPSTTTTAPEPGRDLAAIDLEVGVCIEDASTFTGRQVNEITETDAIACRLPHQAEVYARHDLAGGTGAEFPGVGALRRQAQADCRSRFESFVGNRWTHSELEIAALWPSPESWAVGDRSIVCAVFRLDGQPLTGTARGSEI